MTNCRISLPGDQIESVHADDLGNNLYRIQNIPFFRHDVHLHDVVLCSPATIDALPQMDRVVRRSGNSTVVIQLVKPVHDKHPLFDRFKALNMSSEGFAAGWLSVNIPANVLYSDVRRILESEPVVAEYKIYQIIV